MARCILNTVGTSLLTNSEGRPWAGWRRGQPPPDLGTVTDWLKTADQSAASAETNTLEKLDLSPEDQLVFLHSDTREGAFTAKALAEHYTARGHRVVLERLGELGYGAQRFTAGLKSLIERTMHHEEAARLRGQEVVVCATGGFKAEIAFLNVLGALLQIEVVYLHEAFRELVRLPRLPLAWDPDFVLDQEAFFEWIEADLRTTHEVESWLQSVPMLRTLVESDGDGHSCLNAAGSLLYKAAKQRLGKSPPASWPEASTRPPSDKYGVSAIEHHRPNGWRSLVSRICAVDCVTLVQYDIAAYNGATVKVLDEDSGTLALRYGPVDQQLPLRIETTARGKEQCELIIRHLKTLLR